MLDTKEHRSRLVFEVYSYVSVDISYDAYLYLAIAGASYSLFSLFLLRLHFVCQV